LAELELTGNVSEPRGIKTAISKSGEYFSAALPAWNDKAPAILLLWTVAGSRQVGRITLPANILSLSFSPDESSLAAGLEDSTARLWDVRTTEELRSFTHEGRVRDVQFDPAGKYLVTASSDKTSRVWEVASGHEVAQMVQDDDLVAAQFSPDGKYVLNETIGAAISFWPWRTSDLVTEACRRLSRNLSVDEWRTYLPGEPYSKTCPNLP
jgi:WD40 repeat protein